MGPKTLIATDAQTVPNFLIIRKEQRSTILRLPDDMRTGAMHFNISKNHTIFCRHIDHKCCYEAKTNGQLLRELLAVNFQSSVLLTFKNIG